MGNVWWLFLKFRNIYIIIYRKIWRNMSQFQIIIPYRILHTGWESFWFFSELTLEILTQCHLGSTAYPDSFRNAVDDEFDARLVQGSLSIFTLCRFVRLLSEEIRGCSDRVHNIFVHLAARVQEIQVEHISTLWPILKYMSIRWDFINI